MKKKWTRLLIIILFLILAWFLGVDQSFFSDSYPCGSFKLIHQYRVLGIPVKTKSNVFFDIKHLIAVDLGITCDHSDFSHWHVERRWGLVICAFPCHRGTIAMRPEYPWYNGEMRIKIKNMAKESPEIAEEFQRKVLIEKDSDYLEKFIKKLQALEK
jgi:hypothetical protein